MKLLAVPLLLLCLQDESINDIIERLGAQNMEERDKAEDALRKLGEKAEPQLKKALQHPDAEVRIRADKLLRQLFTIKLDTQALFVQRLSQKRNNVARGGGGTDTEDAVLAGLKWLSRHQEEDGSWKTKDYTGRCNLRIPSGKIYGKGKCTPNPGRDDHSVGVTGLALLAFLGAGYSPQSRDTYDGITFGATVKKGLAWLTRTQKRDGRFEDESSRGMYNHAVATLALVETSGLLPHDEALNRCAARAMTYLVNARTPGSGWGYEADSDRVDSSVTTWAALACVIAARCKADIKDKLFRETRDWFASVTDKKGRVGYLRKGELQEIPKISSERFTRFDTPTAGALFVRSQTGDKVNMDGGTGLLMSRLPEWRGQEIDFLYWHLASLAILEIDGDKSAHWRKWNAKMRPALVKNQVWDKKACKWGSWEPYGRWCSEAGRVYATAINVLTLETYYRYRREKK